MTAKQIRGKVTVKLDNKNYQLKYNMNALAEIQDQLNISGLEEIISELENVDFKKIRLLLWAGLLHNHTDENDDYTITQKQVGAMSFNLKDVVQSISKAIQYGMGIDEQDMKSQTVTEKNA